MKMQQSITINGWTFELDEEESFYQCRGPIMYDYDHDEMPDPSLWKAARQLRDDLTKMGFTADHQYSEKGWVEVYFDD